MLHEGPLKVMALTSAMRMWRPRWWTLHEDLVLRSWYPGGNSSAVREINIKEGTQIAHTHIHTHINSLHAQSHTHTHIQTHTHTYMRANTHNPQHTR